MGCGKKEKPSGKKAFVSKLEILRPVLGGAQGRRHLRFPLQGVVLVFFTGVPLGLLAQGAYHFPFLPAVVLAVGTAGLDIPPKEGLLFLFAEPSHRRPFLSLATGLDITPAVGTSRRRLSSRRAGQGFYPGRPHPSFLRLLYHIFLGWCKRGTGFLPGICQGTSHKYQECQAHQQQGKPSCCGGGGDARF